MERKVITDFGAFTAEVTYKNVKHCIIGVRSDGTPRISVPFGTKEGEISALATKYEAWVLKKIAEITRGGTQTAYRNFPTFQNGGFMALFGQEYPVEYRVGKRFSVEREGDTLCATCPRVNLSDPEAREKAAESFRAALDRFMKKIVAERVAARLPYYEKTTGLKSRSVRVKKMKSRWGSCNIADKGVTFSSFLALYPPECLDMVVVHELGHLKHSGHGKDFYAFMDRYYPDWKRAVTLLKCR